MKHFSLNAWKPAIGRKYGDVTLLALGFDWSNSGELPPYYAIDIRLLGFGVSLAFWPRGKDMPSDELPDGWVNTGHVMVPVEEYDRLKAIEAMAGH